MMCATTNEQEADRSVLVCSDPLNFQLGLRNGIPYKMNTVAVIGSMLGL